VVTCVDDAGDLTVGIVPDGVQTVRRTAGEAAGPWVVGDDFVVITYDGDEDRGRQVAEALGGELYSVDGDGEPTPFDG
jgi:hypothetical protein